MEEHCHCSRLSRAAEHGELSGLHLSESESESVGGLVELVKEALLPTMLTAFGHQPFMNVFLLPGGLFPQSCPSVDGLMWGDHLLLFDWLPCFFTPVGPG